MALIYSLALQIRDCHTVSRVKPTFCSITTFLVSDQRGAPQTISLLINLLLVWLLFSKAHLILKFIGAETSEAIAKIFALLLAAIGVMLIRLGVTGML